MRDTLTAAAERARENFVALSKNLKMLAKATAATAIRTPGTHAAAAQTVPKFEGHIFA